MTDRELMQMALDALEHLQTDVEWQYKSPTRAMLRKVENALRARLELPDRLANARKWISLTDKDYEAMAEKHVTDCYFDTLKYAKDIEARLRHKNEQK